MTLIILVIMFVYMATFSANAAPPAPMPPGVCFGVGLAEQWDGRAWVCTQTPMIPGPPGPPGQPGSAYGAPASSSAPCSQGDSLFTADFVYLCVATNTWVRFAPGAVTW